MNEHFPSQLNIKDAETVQLAGRLAKLTGQTLTSTVKAALQEKLDREMLDREQRKQRILEIVKAYNALPDRDTRSADEILGYDENGLPT